MKKTATLLITLLSIIIVSCKDEKEELDDNNKIVVGTWKCIGWDVITSDNVYHFNAKYYSQGGSVKQYYFKDYYETRPINCPNYIFYEDGNYKFMDRNAAGGFVQGIYSYQDGIITLPPKHIIGPRETDIEIPHTMPIIDGIMTDTLIYDRYNGRFVVYLNGDSVAGSGIPIVVNKYSKESNISTF